MSFEFSRTELLIGSEAMEKLRRARAAVFGIGGVGGAAAEALARCGIGSLDLIDNDTISETNINRQVFALKSNVGRLKTEVAAERIADISPDTKVRTHNIFFLPGTDTPFDFGDFDYVIDAIDTMSGKLEIIVRSKAAGVPVISSMGAGNKLDPTAFEVSDIYKTSVCPLARVMRRELKKRGITDLKTVYSKEPPIKPKSAETIREEGSKRRSLPGSISFVPPVVGLIIAGEVIRDIAEIKSLC